MACCADGLIKLFTLNVEPSSEQTCCISSTLSTSFHPTGGTGGMGRGREEGGGREGGRVEGERERRGRHWRFGEGERVEGERERRGRRFEEGEREELMLSLLLFRFND